MDIFQNVVTKKLLDLWDKKSLAHFYIVKTSLVSESPREYLTSYLKHLVSYIFSKSLNMSFESALNLLPQGRFADLLIIEKEEGQNKNYHVDDFEEFFRFLEFSFVEIPHKFIIINDAHLLTETICNKLLKSLEAPSNQTTIFLIDHEHSHLLDTLQSRGINLFIPLTHEEKSPQHISGESFISYVKNSNKFTATTSLESFLEGDLSLLDFVEVLKKKEGDLANLVTHILEYESHQKSNYKQKENILKFLQFYNESILFHNSPSTRAYKTIQLLKTL